MTKGQIFELSNTYKCAEIGSPLSFIDGGYSFNTMVAFGVYMTTKVSYHRHVFRIKCLAQTLICLKSVLLIVDHAVTFFDRGCSYLAQ